jgi:hypothetical protein
MSDEFPVELRQFIAQNIESLAQLEALLMLRSESQRTWGPAELAQRLYITPEMCQALLVDLHRRGFIEAGADGECCRYHARDAGADRLLGDLAALYQQRRVAVITEIYSKPVTKVQTFADAFRLRKEDKP